MWNVPASLCASVTGLFLVDPTREHLICSLVPSDDGNHFILRAALFCVDCTIAYFNFAIIFFVILTCLLTFGATNAMLEKEIGVFRGPRLD